MRAQGGDQSEGERDMDVEPDFKQRLQFEVAAQAGQRRLFATEQTVDLFERIGAEIGLVTGVDADGVAMAAIQGLNTKVGEQLAVIKKQSTRLESLERELRDIKALLGVK